MQLFFKKIFRIIMIFIAVGFLASPVFAAGNITSGSQYSQFINTDLDNNGTNDFINWSPTNFGATVSDSAITGYIWGESVGWINLNPSGPAAQVTNTCEGDLGGYAWGQNTGWINFAPTGATIAPNINITNGAITGQVWSQNYGWIELASSDGTYPGLTTAWRPSDACGTPEDEDDGDDGGGDDDSDDDNEDEVVDDTDDVVDDNEDEGEGEGEGEEEIDQNIPTNQTPDVPSNYFQNIPDILNSNPQNPKNLMWPAILGLIGIASTIPGMVTRLGNQILTFAWGRKKIRGVVYDSLTKEPLDPVYVSVISLETNQEVKNQFTDMEGRFGFVLPQGRYKITAGKTHYQFPSVRLAGRDGDEAYDRLYFGQPFTVENEQEVVSMNIPMDPIDTDWNQVEKHKTRFFHYLMNGQTRFTWIFEALFVLGFCASIIITFFYPIWWNYIMTGMYALLSLIKIYVRKSLHAGVVTKNGKPLAYAMVRVWNAALNHEVAKKVTEQSGAYYILIPKGDYYITIDERGPDGVFTQIFKSDVMHAHGGAIHKSFDL